MDFLFLSSTPSEVPLSAGAQASCGLPLKHDVAPIVGSS
jgi:hypothetical protein